MFVRFFRLAKHPLALVLVLCGAGDSPAKAGQLLGSRLSTFLRACPAFLHSPALLKPQHSSCLVGRTASSAGLVRGPTPWPAFAETRLGLSKQRLLARAVRNGHTERSHEQGRLSRLNPTSRIIQSELLG
jgi:hypothetical protein